MNKFSPVESLTNASQVTFVLPHFMGPFAYLPSGILLQVDMKMSMVKNAAGEGPDIPAAKKVSPCNNTLNSLFRSCRVWLGETLITKNGENYPFKSYFIDLLSNDGGAKFSWLESQMYYQDVFGSTLATQTGVSNSGYNSRMNLFKLPDQTAYHNGTVTAIGKLHTDLSSTETGILPGVGLRIELAFSSDDFLLQTPKADVEKYKLTIEKATLYCPVAQLSAEMFRKIDLKLNEDDARIYISRCEVTNKSISVGNSMFTDRLFAGANLPSKLIIAFTPTTNYVGSQKSNPFYFPRTFPLPDTAEVDASGNSSPAHSFTTCEELGAGTSGRGRNIVEEVREVQGGPNSCFIEQVKVTLNGDSLDGFDGNAATWREDISMFMRLHYYMGFANSRTGNALTYKEFMNGFFLPTMIFLHLPSQIWILLSLQFGKETFISKLNFQRGPLTKLRCCYLPNIQPS